MTRTLLTAILLTLFSQTAFGSTKLICGYDKEFGRHYKKSSLLQLRSEDVIKSLQRNHMVIEVDKEKKRIIHIPPKETDPFLQSVNESWQALIDSMTVKQFSQSATRYSYVATDITEIDQEGMKFIFEIDRIDGSYSISMVEIKRDSVSGKNRKEINLMYAGICDLRSNSSIKF